MINLETHGGAHSANSTLLYVVKQLSETDTAVGMRANEILGDTGFMNAEDRLQYLVDMVLGRSYLLEDFSIIFKDYYELANLKASFSGESL